LFKVNTNHAMRDVGSTLITAHIIQIRTGVAAGQVSSHAL
jgi:hypothetical protein